jgi:hypothetical protein
MNYQQVRQHLESLLGIAGTGTLLQLNSATRERAYEAYVAELVAEAVRQAGGSARIRGILSGDNPPNPIVFRGSPGQMDSGAQNFCFYRCSLAGQEFEIHLDVKYAGSSSAVHEIDVSVFKKDAADRVRQNGVLPKASAALLMTFECKFYEDDPGAALARTYVGLISDCSPTKLNGFVSNRGGTNIRRYLSKSQRPEPFLDLLPGNPDAEDRFKHNVEQALRKWTGT